MHRKDYLLFRQVFFRFEQNSCSAIHRLIHGIIISSAPWICLTEREATNFPTLSVYSIRWVSLGISTCSKQSYEAFQRSSPFSNHSIFTRYSLEHISNFLIPSLRWRRFEGISYIQRYQNHASLLILTIVYLSLTDCLGYRPKHIHYGLFISEAMKFW